MARRGKDNITVRMDLDLWERFGQVAEKRSELIREFVRYYVGEVARPPRRPVKPR
jgi:metal-responsive CopG/Arc/MetJ family transcriptional regulator